MNERIKQLASDCGLYIAYDNREVTGKELEYFAELIIRECTDIGDKYQDILGNEPECFNCRKVAYGIVDKIKEHFGVE
jgi:hypothetical protein